MVISMENYRIRAHHGMCLAFFKGKGYSNEFAKHMGEIKEILEGNPVVEVVVSTDDICVCCPNNIGGECDKPDKVAGYDNMVLKKCDLAAGMSLPWKEFERLVRERILMAGRREEICGDCQWNGLCYFTESKKSDK